VTPLEQARAFGVMALCGVCLGAAYDLLGPLRRVTGLCAITDLLFGLCCAAGMIQAALFLRCDAFRLYAFAGVGCGMALYGTTLGALLRYAGRHVRKRIQKREEKWKNRQSTAGI